MRSLQKAPVHSSPRLTQNLYLYPGPVHQISAAQIREQMSGPEISQYEKSILGSGLWPGLDCGKKGSGPILSIIFGCFFQFFMGKKKIENIVASALKSCIEKR